MLFARTQKPLSEDSVLAALRNVEDPDLRKDIVSLGFVKNLRVSGGDVLFTLELTTPACPVKENLRAQCEQNIMALEGVKSVHVEMTASVRRSVPIDSQRIVLPGVKNVIAVASGKGGVGKSTVTVNLAGALRVLGAKTGVLDADIYGPSLPTMFAITERPQVRGEKVIPIEKFGMKLISMGFFAAESQPIVWRGPMVHSALVQFLGQVDWGDLDYLFIDMPPGTGDAQLTISQSAPVSGAIIVTTPQELSLIDARRGLRMFQTVKVPIIGVIENMSDFICPHCNTVTPIFSCGGGEKLAAETGVPLIAKLPLVPEVAKSGDVGTPLVFEAEGEETRHIREIYIETAEKIAAALSILQAKGNVSSFCRET